METQLLYTPILQETVEEMLNFRFAGLEMPFSSASSVIDEAERLDSQELLNIGFCFQDSWRLKQIPTVQQISALKQFISKTKKH
jgi:hypothetical protein